MTHEKARQRLPRQAKCFRFLPRQIFAKRRASARLALRQPPVRTDEVAGVAVGIAFEIILMLGLGFPEVPPARPRCTPCRARCLEASTSAMVSRGHALLLGAGVVDRRAIAHADVVALAVAGRRIVDLEEEFEQLPIAEYAADRRRSRSLRRGCRGCDRSRSGRRRRYSRRGSRSRRYLADQILHAPETAAGQNGPLGLLSHLKSPLVCSVGANVGSAGVTFNGRGGGLMPRPPASAGVWPRNRDTRRGSRDWPSRPC